MSTGCEFIYNGLDFETAKELRSIVTPQELLTNIVIIINSYKKFNFIEREEIDVLLQYFHQNLSYKQIL